MKIRPVEAELFHVDWRTDGPKDVTVLPDAFRNFVNAPKILKRQGEGRQIKSHK